MPSHTNTSNKKINSFAKNTNKVSKIVYIILKSISYYGTIIITSF